MPKLKTHTIDGVPQKVTAYFDEAGEMHSLTLVFFELEKDDQGVFVRRESPIEVNITGRLSPGQRTALAGIVRNVTNDEIRDRYK